jgi:hypothetical protein
LTTWDTRLVESELATKGESLINKVKSGETSPRELLKNFPTATWIARESKTPRDIPEGIADHELMYLLPITLWQGARVYIDWYPSKARAWAERAALLGSKDAAAWLGLEAWKENDFVRAKTYFQLASKKSQALELSKDLADGYLLWIAQIERRRGIEFEVIPSPLQTQPLPENPPSWFDSVWIVHVDTFPIPIGYRLASDFSLVDSSNRPISGGSWKLLESNRIQIFDKGFWKFEGIQTDLNTITGTLEIDFRSTTEKRELNFVAHRAVDQTISPDSKSWNDHAQLAGSVWKLVSLDQTIDSVEPYTTFLQFNPDHSLTEIKKATGFDESKGVIEELMEEALWTTDDSTTVRWHRDSGFTFHTGQFVDSNQMQGSSHDKQGRAWKWIAIRTTREQVQADLEASKKHHTPAAAMVAQRTLSNASRQLRADAPEANLRQAVTLASNVINSMDDLVLAYEIRCKAHLLLRELPEAEADVERILELAPYALDSSELDFFVTKLSKAEPRLKDPARHHLFQSFYSKWEVRYNHIMQDKK